MKSKKLSDLPIPQSGCGNTRLVSDGVILTLEFEYRAQSQDWIGGVRFESVLAYRFRNEAHSKGYSSDGFEALAEIFGSSWKDELGAIAPSGFDDVQSKRHFAVFLSSNGYFEIFAETFSVLEPRRGLLE